MNINDFYYKEGWMINPDPKIVRGILKGIERNNGECPCQNDSEDKHCPCSNFRLKDKCCCKLYIRIEESLQLL